MGESCKNRKERTLLSFVGIMGLCFGTRIKTERALQNGEIETGNNMNGSGTNVSSNEVASSLLIEGEIMQSPKLRRFSFSDLKVATGDFNPNSLLGEGAFGCVYEGWIDKHSFTPAKPETGMAIAVKTLNPKGTQGQQEWLAEIMYLGQLRHPNLVELIGYCIENYYRLLVYEFMPNRSLENHLFGGTSDFQPLSWNLRVKVALGAAKGLAFLHKKAHVVHRDFKTSDILLDSGFNAKLSDFGLAKDGPTSGRSHVTTRVVGTYGYAAPEYIGTGHVSPKSDVYSFGVVLLEVLTGKRAIDNSRPAGEQNLVEWAKPYLNNKRRVFLLMDSRIADQFSPKSVIQATKLAVRCLSTEPKLRPDMEAVAKELEEISQIIDNETSTAPRS